MGIRNALWKFLAVASESDSWFVVALIGLAAFGIACGLTIAWNVASAGLRRLLPSRWVEATRHSFPSDRRRAA